MPTSPRIGSLCTGYGGLDMAARAVFGGEPVWHAEIDPHAARVLAHRFPTVPNLGDIKALNWAAVPPIELLTAGYPCQPMSAAGLKKGQDDERWLWPWVADAIRVLRPRIVVLENVENHLRLGFDHVLGDLAALRFDAEWLVCKASDLGAAHPRARLFILAWPADAPSRRPQGRRIPRHPAERGAVPAAHPDRVSLRPEQVREPRREPAPLPGHARGTGLLPTPRTTDGNGAGAHGQGGLDLRTAVTTLPTPRASDGAKAGPNQRDSHGNPALAAAVQTAHWGRYAAAVARHARLIGRPAPAPTIAGRNGPRLNPALTEWLMCLPEGWVTAVPRISPNQALHILGNGVVPLQAEAAIRALTARAD